MILISLLLSLISLLLVLLLQVILNLERAKELRAKELGLVKDDPSFFKEAMDSSESPFRKKAIDSEIKSIMKNNTWILTDLSPGCKLISCKWIFKKKLRLKGTVDKYKARLVAKGFTQQKVLISLTPILLLLGSFLSEFF